MRRFVRLAAAALACFAAAPVQAQGFNTFNGRSHPELDWQEAETAHFRLLYPRRLAGIEAEAAAVAERTYAVLSQTLGVTFDRKIPIYLSDEDEIVNGFATPLLGGYSMIWVHQNENAETWTGPHGWLRKVIAHELVHLFHYRAVRGNVGLLSTVYPNAVPRFVTEGLAQYLTERWDSERGERWLRTAALEGRLNYADGSGQDGRLLYAVGNSQVRFLAHQYGDSALARVLAHRTPLAGGLVRVHDFPRAVEAVTGESLPAFLARWRRHASTLTGVRAAAFAPPESLGVRLRRDVPLGQYTADLRPMPGDTARWTSVRLVSLARPVTQLIVAERGRERVLAEGPIHAPVAVRPGGREVAFAQTGRARHGSLLSDLYAVDVATGRLRTLTRNRRAWHPAYSPDGRRLAFVETVGGTANVVVRDLETGAERRVTGFTGDVQIGGLAWRPALAAGATGRTEAAMGDSVGAAVGGSVGAGVKPAPTAVDHLAVAVFDAEGRRDVRLLDLATGRMQPLTDGAHDDREPVWRPDGRALAVTSLRDGVPNVWTMDVAADGTPSAPVRRTDAVQGARATAWLAPGTSPRADTARTSPTQQAAGDSLGRLVVLSAVSRTGDAAFLVDAARERPEPTPLAPEAALAAWETHAPPQPLPDAIPPDPSLITARRPYHSLARTQHVVTLPFPYVYDGVWGAGAATAWLEPLGKHQLTALAAVTPTNLDKSFLLATYRTTVLGLAVDLSAYRYPGAARLYGADVLVERLVGAELALSQPIELGRTPYTGAGWGLAARVRRAEPLNAEDFVDVTGGLPLPVAATQGTLTATLGWKQQRPWRDNAVHPLDGTAARGSVTLGAASDGQARFARATLAAYRILPSIGLHRVLLYGRLAGQVGTSLPQDYLGLARLDPIELGTPSYLPLSFGRNDRVRGYRQAVVGKAVAFGTAEYRVPLGDLQTVLLGLARLGTLTGAAFVDGALVGQDLAFSERVARLGYGGELRTGATVSGLGLGLGAQLAVGVAWAAEAGRPREVYTRVGFAVPF